MLSNRSRTAQQSPASGSASNSAKLKQLLADEWDYELRENPELATSIGDYRYNDRWSDSSLEHVRRKKDMQHWLEKFQGLDVSSIRAGGSADQFVVTLEDDEKA